MGETTRVNCRSRRAFSSSAIADLSSPSAAPFDAMAVSTSRSLAAPDGRRRCVRPTSETARASTARSRAISPSDRLTAA